jgi:hypothetical protein
MWTDPIVEEVRRVREAYAAQFDFDLRRISDDLRRKYPTAGDSPINEFGNGAEQDSSTTAKRD